MIPARTRTRLGALGAVAAVAAAWLVFAPMQLGGATAYATIDGVSMEPHLHGGDLVLIHRVSEFRVGDVVAYRSPLLHRVVLHRIVRIDHGRYVFKGDNNDFLDPGAVAPADLIGREWVRLPHAGALLAWLHLPWLAALVVIGAVALLLGGRPNAGRRRRRGRDAPLPDLTGLLRPAAPWAAVGAAVCGAAALLGFMLPATRQAPVADLYSFTGRFSYSGTGAPSAAYPDGRVRTGQAVFTNLVGDVDLGFSWTFGSARPHGVHGAASLAVVVADGSGWSRSLAVTAPRRYAGDRVRVAGAMNLDRIRALIDRFQQETGRDQAQYTVTVAPRVTVSGVVDGHAVADVYAPTLGMLFDGRELRAGDGSGDAPSFLRSQSQPGTVPVAGRLALAGHGISLRTARSLGSIGFLLSILVLVGAARASGRLRERDPVAAELAAAGHAVIQVEDERRAARVVEMRNLAGLIRIANRYDRLILHAAATGAYLVQDEDVVYRWCPAPSAATRFVERRNPATRPWADRLWLDDDDADDDADDEPAVGGE